MRVMDADYDLRLRSLVERRTARVPLGTKAARFGAPGVTEYYSASRTYEVYGRLPSEGSAVRYTVGAMARVDPKYTEITYEQGERIKNQIAKALEAADAACEFEYQGSVTNDTHIKAYSDIDLLAITGRFTTLEPPQKAAHPYDGNPVDDLREIRTTACEHLRTAFPEAEVDDSGSKCISICGGSLCRKIDVVPANWYDTNAYAAMKAKRYRAIQVLDVKSGERIKNAPFLHNYLIDERDQRTSGGLRKVIRLMKSLKYDSNAVSLSSYDLAAIGYRMPEDELSTCAGEEIALLARLKSYLDTLAADSEQRKQMLIPDDSRAVFTDGFATLAGLNELRHEVDVLTEKICQNRHNSFAKLAEARLSY